MMPGSKGQKAVHACMIRLLNLGPAKHEEGVICVANQRIPNVCRIAGAACCGAIRGRQLGAKDLLTPTSCYYILPTLFLSMVLQRVRKGHHSNGYSPLKHSTLRFLPSVVMVTAPLSMVLRSCQPLSVSRFKVSGAGCP